MSQDLYERLKLYGSLTSSEKDLLLLSATYNDVRLIFGNPKDRLNYAKSLLQTPSPPQRVIQIHQETWKEDIFEIYQNLCSISDIDHITKAAILNKYLSAHNLCPFVHYAFSMWHDIETISDVLHLAELGPTYLYKLIPHKITCTEETGTFLGSGAYGDVYLCENQRTVLKLPRNLAALSFMNRLEMEAYQVGLTTPLKQYLAPVVHYSETTAVIEKIYIKGISGWRLLEDSIFRDHPYEIGQIREIYALVSDIYRKTGINIDMHPGNFQWHPDERRWYLIDYGSMPEIGADYFPHDSFEAYFKKIWLDLHNLMITVPIRSLDIEIP